jgi:glycosyltransferase involved in cell wall biosynthesis
VDFVSLVQVSNHESYAREDDCGVLSNSQLLDEFELLMRGDDFVRILTRSSQLASIANRSGDPLGLMVDLRAFSQRGAFPSLLAMESLAAVKHRNADQQLIEFLAHPDQLVRRHATWLLGRRKPVTSAFGPLVEQLAVGGMDSMHAFRTLRRWSTASPDGIRAHLVDALESVDDGHVRARLIDLLGSLKQSNELLARFAADSREALAARIAAIGALGDLPGSNSRSTLQRLAGADDVIGVHAALALSDLEVFRAPPAQSNDAGLRIAQLVLAAGLDGELSRGGLGDTGGVASLLVSLGEALACRPEVDRVLTVSRGTLADSLSTPGHLNDSSLAYAIITVGDHGRPAETPDAAWEHLPAIKRGLRRVMQEAAPIDMLHLRMADAGTLAGAEVAEALGVPVCFSAAPDPHNVIHSLQSRGELDQDKFLQLCTKEHLWFRARLVERLAERANRLILFPRAKPCELLDVLGIDSRRYGERAAVVSEGVDVDLIRRAADNYECEEKETQGQPDILLQLAGRIPKSRRDLPLLLSIGRFNPVKGMERVAAAWACDPLLQSRYNLVLVGGDLVNPSQTEQTVLDAIDQVIPVGSKLREGLVLLGGRPRADVARLLVATVRGRAGFWSKGGLYVDGALKEEFGLALIEAMAAGLVVIAPSTGGPPTYVVHGDTGVLVDPGADLAAGILHGINLVNLPGRVKRAQTLVEERYSIAAMASQLVSVYQSEPSYR